MITIFTPTYNRCQLLPRLYASLLNQNNKNFEWIVVDDGSTDGTQQLIQQYIDENIIDIKYHYQENQGKHIAINTGVQLATKDLFFIVDSDDFLYENSIDTILSNVEKLKEPTIAGLIALSDFGDRSSKEIETFFGKNFITNPFDLRYKHNFHYDYPVIFKTQVLKNYPFPVFTGEKFCRETLIYFRISRKFNFFFLNQFIYNARYQSEGLSSNFWNTTLKSPEYSLLYFIELYKMGLNKQQKLTTLNHILALFPKQNIKLFAKYMFRIPFFPLLIYFFKKSVNL